MNGGYVILDTAGIDLTAQSAKTVSGIFAKCQEAFDIVTQKLSITPIQAIIISMIIDHNAELGIDYMADFFIQNSCINIKSYNFFKTILRK